MTLLFDGKGTFKSRNGGWLAIFNTTTSRDFHESLPLVQGNEIDRALPTPFGVPVIAYASYDSGVVTAGIKILGLATIPLFHKTVARVGDSIPISWSIPKLGLGLVGAVIVQ